MHIKQLIFSVLFLSAVQFSLVADQMMNQNVQKIMHVLKENLTVDGPVQIKESTIQTATVKGDATIESAAIFTLNVTGNANFDKAKVKTLILNGNLNAEYSSIDDATVTGSEVTLSFSDVNKLVLKKDSSGKAQVVHLNDNSKVNSISFESNNGRVIVDNPTIKVANLQGGKIENK